MLKNFIATIKRFKLAGALNLAGLGVAFAAFMIIMIQLNYDWNFDRFHRDADRIFRLEVNIREKAQAVIARPFAETFFQSSPHIVAGAITDPFTSEMFLHVMNSDVRNFYTEKSMRVSEAFTEVFQFNWIEGNSEALKTPNSAIIPQSMAQRLFGTVQAMGRQFTTSKSAYTVSGVYSDFPANTIIGNCIYTTLNDENKNEWGNWNYHTYIRVNDAANVAGLFDTFKQYFEAPKTIFGEDFSWEEAGELVKFTALPDIHYVTDIFFDTAPKANRQTLTVLFAIAIVIVVIACINFINFSMALAPMRIKSINTRKVIGASQIELRAGIIMEAVLISMAAYLLALVLMELFASSPLAKLVDASLKFSANPFIIGGTAAAALLTGILAGVYPAFYMTQFAPALVLKGSFGLSPKGRRLRNLLTGVQFTASIALIVGAAFIFLQNRYMQQSPMGYDNNNLLAVDLQQAHNVDADVLAQQLKAHAGIKDVTYSMALLSSQDSYMSWGRDYRGNNITFVCLPVHHSFLKIMGIDVMDGRDFRTDDITANREAYIFNETARAKYNIELNTKIDDGEIIGFINDIKFASFRNTVEPMAFFVTGNKNWTDWKQNAIIRISAGADMRAAMEHIRSTLAQYNADFTFNIRFYDSIVQQMYEKETSLGSLITLFSIIATFIALVGVFGMVVFDSEYRRKEIGIRKVHGATVTNILMMFNAVYIRIVAVCFAIAAPVAWYIVNEWLSRFAYRTSLHWWVFIAALIIVLALTVGIVSIQNWKTASENPVKSLKTE
ncbi:MAG: ABC transporter permease [Cytophagaceae bacterium]|jgi:putative ABC transport system permease protein|nr:ABC transporter permease [Cytophagaceae bacterium]